MAISFKKKLVLMVVIAVLVFLFFRFNLNMLITIEGLKAAKEDLLRMFTAKPFLVLFMYSLIYLGVVFFNLPGGLVLGLAAGAIFGFVNGVIVVSFMSSISATVACYFSRFLFRDIVYSKFSVFIERIDEGIRREGVFYLFALRLVPVIPFFIVNMVMGLTNIELKKYYIVSQVGMLPATMVIVNAGSQLGSLNSANDLMSPGFVLSLAMIGVLPLLLKKILDLIQKNKMNEQEIT